MNVLLKDYGNPDKNLSVWCEAGEWIGLFYRMYRYGQIFMQVPGGQVLKID